MDLQKTLKNYLDELSSNSPTPGGGNVAAMCGVLASSLGQMVCNLTIGKKKYLSFEKEVKDILIKLENIRNEFLILAEKDNEAFDRVMDAFKLPKGNDEQISFRRTAIEKATFEAALIPEEVIKKCSSLIPLLNEIAEKGNKNSLSDSGVAISLTASAAESAFLNVAINCSGLTNQITANELLKRSEIIYLEVKEKSRDTISAIINKIVNR